jgi:nicotinate dehydrogenase subunit B
MSIQVTLPASLKTNPLLSQWLQFLPNGSVQVKTGKVELGQGILHALKVLAAEELCVSLAQVTLCEADTASGPDEGMTSGSLSIQDSGVAIRHACAHARHLLLKHCAQQQGCAIEELHVRSGVAHKGTQRIAAYADLAPHINWQQAVDIEHPKLPSSAWQWVGHDLERADVRALVEGDPIFIHDMVLPDMLHARMVRSDAFHATLDESSWQAAQTLAQQWPPSSTLVRDGGLIGVLAVHERDANLHAQQVLQTLRWQAKPLGLNASSLPQDLQQQTADALVFHTSGEPAASAETQVEVNGKTTTAANANAGTVDAPQTFSATYFRPFLHHASIGTSCAIAQWFSDSTQSTALKVWSHSQGIFALRRDLALCFGLKDAQVHIKHVRGAGCYGHNGADDVTFDAAWIAKHANGRPVRVVWSRRDEMIWSPIAPAMTVCVTAKVDAQHQLLDWQQEVWSQGHSSRPGRAATPALLGSWQTEKPFPALEPINVAAVAGAGAERNSVPPYRASHIQVLANRVLGWPMRTSALRALGAHANVFAAESMMDELAHASNTDPLAYRLGLLDDARARDVLQAVADASQWNALRQQCQPQEGRGVGVAYARYKGKGAYCAVVAQVHVTDVVRVENLWVAADVGLVVQPDGAKLQLEGGAIQSTSWALKEAAQFDETSITSNDWEHYPILRFSEVPQVHVQLMARSDQPSLGAGEATQGPTTAAIANAVFHALGVRVHRLPLTPEALTQAINALA